MSVLMLIIVMKMQMILSYLITNNPVVLFSAALPPVRHLWVSSSFPALRGLQVQWENPTAPSSVPPVTHLAVQWRSETRPSSSGWTTVDNATTSTVIPGETVLDYYNSSFIKCPTILEKILVLRLGCACFKLKIPQPV